MHAVISTTYDDKYLFFLPITVWCWNKLGVEVICFIPQPRPDGGKTALVTKTIIATGLYCALQIFKCPETKEATYAQCSRLYAGAFLPDDEILITSDVDMAVFKLPPREDIGFSIFGADLVPSKQLPICYISANVKEWTTHLTKGRRMQECIDSLLGSIECENMRGNYWGKDQEEIYNSLNYCTVHTFNRARPGTQFAANRADRDDTNWRSYLGPNLFDAHLWRPGHTDENFANIMELLTTQYPNEDFQWLRDYREAYIKLL